MKVEKSCGAVVYTIINGKRKYVVISNLEGMYGFPKGHMELGESKKETAIREIKEETNLDVNMIDGFEEVVEHTFFRGTEEILKNVTYFVAEYKNQEFRPQEEELSKIELMDYEEAMNKFQFENNKIVLKKAEEYLSNKEK